MKVIEKLKEVTFYCPRSELMNHKDTIENYFREHPPSTIAEAIAKIEELTGIKRCPTQIRKFLKSIGMRCLKVGMVPSKADPDEQEHKREEKCLGLVKSYILVFTRHGQIGKRPGGKILDAVGFDNVDAGESFLGKCRQP